MNEKQQKVSVSGMTCSGCSSRVQKLLERNEDVKNALVNHETGIAQITGDISEADIRNIVENAGYTFEGVLE